MGAVYADIVSSIPVKSSKKTAKETGMVILISHLVVFHDRGKASKTHFPSLLNKVPCVFEISANQNFFIMKPQIYKELSAR